MSRSVDDRNAPLAEVRLLRDGTTFEEGDYTEIKRLITEGVLRPGAPVSAKALAQRLAVSRVPVIQALRRLASEGFVHIHPHRAIVVAQPTFKEIRGQVVMLLALEDVALREAWPLAPDVVATLASIHQKLIQGLLADPFGDVLDCAFHQGI